MKKTKRHTVRPHYKAMYHGVLLINKKLREELNELKSVIHSNPVPTPRMYTDNDVLNILSVFIPGLLK